MKEMYFDEGDESEISVGLSSLSVDRKLIGPPGTGKTYKGRKYLEEYGCRPSDVCATTFRRRMAANIKKELRASGFLRDEDDGKYIATIHGVIRRILAWDTDDLVKEQHRRKFCERKGIPYVSKRNNDLPRSFGPVGQEVGNLIFRLRGWLINNLKKLDEWDDFPGSDDLPPEINRGYLETFYEDWHRLKQKNGKWDFEDLLRVGYERKVVPPVKVLFIDEFQDLTPIQHEIVREWTKDAEYTVVAGDPAQSIYNFFGASPLFLERCRGEKEFLKHSYRLPDNTIWASNTILRQTGSDREWLKGNAENGHMRVVKSPYQLKKSIRNYPKAFHLVRANWMREKVAKILSESGIPFRGGKGCWSEKELDVLDGLAIIKGKSIKKLPVFVANQIVKSTPADFLKVKKGNKDRGIGFLSDPQSIDVDKLHSIFDREYIKCLQKSGRPLDYFLTSEVDEEMKKKIHRSLKKDFWQSNKRPSRSIAEISTIHGAKGRESETVFLYDNITRRIYENLGSEEMRVWYVGTTRHSKNLFIVNNLFDTLSSPYIQKIIYQRKDRNGGKRDV